MDTTTITIYSPHDNRPRRVPSHQYDTIWFPRGFRKTAAAAKGRSTNNDDAPQGVEENA